MRRYALYRVPILVLNIFKTYLTYPLEGLHVPPGVHAPPFENHCPKSVVSPPVSFPFRYKRASAPPETPCQVAYQLDAPLAN